MSLNTHAIKPPTRSPKKALSDKLNKIRVGTSFETKDIKKLSTLIIDPKSKGLNDHWQKTSFTLLNGLIAHVIYKCKQDETSATWSMIDVILSSPNHSIGELWIEMINTEHVKENGDKPSHQLSLAAVAGQSMISRGEREAGSILSSVVSYLALYRGSIHV